MSRVPLLLAILLLTTTVGSVAQGQRVQNTPEQERSVTRPVNPLARLAAAKTALVRNAEGSDIPYNVIYSAIESWGRFELVSSPEKADIIIEVSAPGTGGSGFSASSSVTRSGPMGREEQPSGTTRQIPNSPIRIIIYDAHSRMALWSGSEHPHSALRQKTREDNLVQASQRLFDKLRDRFESAK